MVCNIIYSFFSCCWIVFVCFSKAFSNREYINLACSIICLWFEGNASLSVRYPYLSVFLMIMLMSFLLLFLMSYSYSYLKRKEISEAKLASTTKQEHGLEVHFLERFMKPLKSIHEEWLNAIFWSSPLLEIFIIK